jgi:predicted RNA-binding protein with PUA domain
MTGGICTCGGSRPGKHCPVCEKKEQPLYWCDGCGQVVTEKRCPLCGLKARKMREGSG